MESLVLGAIVGDIIGSRFEWNNHKSKEFELFTPKCKPTDDTVMTLAVAKALMAFTGDYEKLSRDAEKCMTELANTYPDAGYGSRFWTWIKSENKQAYNSFGNGAAMRISPVAYCAHNVDELKKLSLAVTAISHNHPCGLAGAEAVAVATYLARIGEPKHIIKNYIQANYYNIDFTLDDIRASYTFDVSCQGSVPVALEAFFESKDFEDAIRNAVSVGGDSDTISAITGAVAAEFYKIPRDIQIKARQYLDKNQQEILDEFTSKYIVNMTHNVTD